MDGILLPYGENLHRLSLQSPRENRLGTNGSAGVHDTPVHHVYAAPREWHQKLADGELAHGCAVCMFSPNYLVTRSKLDSSLVLTNSLCFV